MPSTFRRDLESLLNCYSKENGCNTPDFILCDFLEASLAAFDAAVMRREGWLDRGAESAPACACDDKR